MDNFILYDEYTTTVNINMDERHKKKIKYISIFVFSILLACSVIVVILQPPQFARSFIVLFFIIFVLLILYMYGILFLLKQLKLNPKKDWTDYRASKYMKLGFYAFITRISKMWTVGASILIILLIFILVKLLSPLISYVMTLLNLNSNIISEIQTPPEPSLYLIIFSILIILSGFTMMGAFLIFYLIFPKNKLSIFPDTSDIPISFIHKSIDELNLFEFEVEWEKRQISKNKISNLINNALEFISIEDKMWAVPQGLRYHNIIMSGINNKSLRMDLLCRVNGLSIKLNEIIIDLNCMNNVEDKGQIIDKLKKYLKIIEDKEICAIEAVKLDETGNIFGPFRNIIKPLLHLMKIFK